MPTTNTAIDAHLKSAEDATYNLERDILTGNKGPAAIAAVAAFKSATAGIRSELGISTAPAALATKKSSGKGYSPVYGPKDKNKIIGWM